MAGSEISSLILTIAAIALATMITVSMFAISIGVSNSINRTAENSSNDLLTELTVIHVGVDNTSVNNFNVFVLNTGTITISLQDLTLLYDNNYISNKNDSTNLYWSLKLNTGNNQSVQLNPNQLAEITIFLSTEIGTGSHSIIVSLNSFSTTYWFSS